MFFERLKSEREALGLSQQVLAERTGVSLRSQQNYESGSRVPDAEYLAAIAAVGADVLYVLTGLRAPAASAADAVEQALLDSFRRCKPEARVKLIQDAALLAAGVPTNSEPKSSIKASVKKSLFGVAINRVGKK